MFQHDFDPLSDAFARDPYSVYRELRACDGPVYHPRLHIWLLSRFSDVSAAAVNSNCVRSLEAAFPAEEVARRKIAQNWHDMPNHARFVQRSLLDSDGPAHDRLRKQAFRAFTPALIARQREAIERFVDHLIDGLLARGTIDFIADFACHVPGRVIGRVLGVPDEVSAQLRIWSENIVQFFDVGRSTEHKQLAEAATTEFHAYLTGLIAEREAVPRDDLISDLIGRRNAGMMSEDELISLCMLILMAGHGSTIDVLGSGMHALLRFPEAMMALRENPALIAPAIQEMFRFESPLPFFHRYLTEDTVIAGKTLPKGATIGLLYGAANRDPLQFTQADRFDVQRAGNRHLAFGSGPHVCLGNHLARLDMEIIFTTLLQRTRAIELAGEEPAYKRGLAVRGPVSLNVTLAPA
ncbi:cytochrome P450 [Novosphingobium naphthalenivorans]|uniref:cytochrome P450 n=1 Tax=Novosphingobium naphthalenivorans TaxID=273168 RepID=UPI00082AA723|nr:cytochrome P450 [Novosphingobium naphthalenivorans]